MQGARKPVEQGKLRVELQPMPAVRSRKEQASRDASMFGDESFLIRARSHVLQHSRRSGAVIASISDGNPSVASL
jgi:hypothetical protein